jgi:hypothetical protein
MEPFLVSLSNAFSIHIGNQQYRLQIFGLQEQENRVINNIFNNIEQKNENYD